MIFFKINECDVDLIPTIKGLESEKMKVIDALNSNSYEAVAVALGYEDVEAIRRRAEIQGDFQSSELDDVYGYFLKDFGTVNMPDPASTCLIDICVERNIPINPLDMNDEDFSKLYCDTVSTLEFLRENRVLKKAFRTKFDKSSPEAFVKQWDDFINQIKGYKKMSEYRERYMAEQLLTLAKYRKKILVVVEYERVPGMLNLLGVQHGL